MFRSARDCHKGMKRNIIRHKIKLVSFVYIRSDVLLLLLLLVLLLLLFLLSEVELSLGGSSPYTSTDKTNKNKYT